MKRLLALAVLSLATAVPAVAYGLSTKLHARLTPIVSAPGATGMFTATAATTKRETDLRWSLSLSHLTSRPTRATLTFGSPRVTLELCAPCRTFASGRIQTLGPRAATLLHGGATIVVSTRAHSSGELRGTTVRG